MDKKILIISEVFYPEIGSGANRITNLVIELKNKGYKVDVITSEPSYPNKEMYKNNEYREEEKDKKVEEGSNITRIKGSRVKVTSNFFKRLYIYMHFFVKGIIEVVFRKEKYNIVIATTPSPFIGVLGIIAKVRYKAKYILDIRDLWPECIKNIGFFRKSKLALNLAYILEKFILKHVTNIVINSEGFKEYLIKKGYRNIITFIPNGLLDKELNEYKEISEKAIKNEKFTVIYTGMIGLAQNVTSIVRVARHLRNINNIEFKIIGDGVQKERVLELINHYNLTNIKVLDPMPKKNIVKEVAKSHIAMAHLRKDSAFDLVIPGKIIDYMGMGIPIIAGVQGYAEDILKKSRAGIAVDPDNYVSMANSIIHIYLNDELRKFYSENAQVYCRENFSFEKSVNKYIELIEKIARRSSHEKKDLYVGMESLYK